LKVLIKSAKIIDKGSLFDGKKVDILVEDGIIKEIGNQINATTDETVDLPNLNLSVAWCDMRVHGRNPGYEHKEDFTTLENAAINGGFGDVALLPNTNPIIQSKEAVSFLKSASLLSKINIWPIAAASHNCEGKYINEFIDLHKAGSVAFSDGEKAISNTDTILKVLQYLSQFNGLFMNRPEEARLNQFGQMNDSLVSNLLGLKGLPAVSEQMAIQRDLNLLTYLGQNGKNARFHFSTISTANSVDLIRQAKANGFTITCDVAAHQLIFSENELNTFDPNYKVMPPFRQQHDIDALWAGLADGTIDAIVSDHCPHDPESKNLEFDLADFGIIGLETLFAALNKANVKLKYQQIVEKLSYNPRKILGLPTLSIKEGELAHFTLFDTSSKWIFNEGDIQSKSKNSPFVGKEMMGKVLGVFVKGKMNYAK
jgi:dihydroorotase